MSEQNNGFGLKAPSTEEEFPSLVISGRYYYGPKGIRDVDEFVRRAKRKDIKYRKFKKSL